MKAKILITYYSDGSGKPEAKRIYLEPYFDQAELDLGLIDEGYPSKNYLLQDCEIYDPNPKGGVCQTAS